MSNQPKCASDASWRISQAAIAAFVAVMIVVASFAGSAAGTKLHGSAGQKAKNGKATKTPEKSYVLVGAGDIAGCSSLVGAAATAKLIEQIPGTVFAAGDPADDRGTERESTRLESQHHQKSHAVFS